MTMGFDDDGDPPGGQTEEAEDNGDVRMGFEETTEEFVRNLEKNAASSLEKEAARSARTSTSGTTTATGMKKIEEEDELGVKTRNWRKINLSFAIELGELGDEWDDIIASDKKTGNNDNKMKHHPIMSKIAIFMLAVEKKCNTVKIMSSKKKMVEDLKACIDSWSINEVKTLFAYSIAKNRNKNVQVILYIDYGKTVKLWTMKNKVFETLKAKG
jgi:hypothetical protein